jgi:hypothetical protein
MQLAGVQMECARCLFDGNKPADARTLLGRTRASLEQLQKQHPDHAGVRAALAEVRTLLATKTTPPADR